MNDIGLDTTFLCAFSLALGPLVYLYVLKITRPEYKVSYKDLPHFGPLIPGLVLLRDSPVLLWLAFNSVIIYLYCCHRLIEHFYQRLKFNELNDRYRSQLRWLGTLLKSFGLLWLLWIPYAIENYFDRLLPVSACYPLYLLLAVSFIRIAIICFFKQDLNVPVPEIAAVKPSVPAEFMQKSIWLKEVIKANLYYRDEELSLRKLAETLDMTSNELSRIINLTQNKSFPDFINEYRVAEVVRKMQDPSNDRLTLIGIAMDAGFNSKSTFNRIFKHMTGKSPAEFKRNIKNERPDYTLRPYKRQARLNSVGKADPIWGHDNLNRKYMIQAYFKTAWRNLVRGKSFSFINISGLAVGMAGAVLILLWLQQEVSFDKFHANKDNLYQVYGLGDNTDGHAVAFDVTSQPLAPALMQDYPEVKLAARVQDVNSFLFTANDKRFTGTKGAFTDTSFLNMFSFPLVKGNKNDQLRNVYSITITQKLALKLFGTDDALGKIIRIDSIDNFTVAGILKDLPANTRFDFDYLLPWGYFRKIGWNNEDWINNSTPTYLLLKPGTNLNAFNEKIKNFTRVKAGRPDLWSHFIFPLSQWHLYSKFENGKPAGGRIETVRTFAVIAIFILLIACINFINLSTAQSEKRAKEVGIRKVAGAGKGLLIGQFICEAYLTVVIAGVFTLLIVLLVLPFFNTLIAADLSVPFKSVQFWLSAVLFTIVTGLLAGSYPAFYLSAFKPVSIFRKQFKKTSAAITPRKVLVVIQFTFAIILIISTTVVQNQIKYTQDRDKGYANNNLVQVQFDGDIGKNYNLIKQELLGNDVAVSVTKVMHGITENGWHSWGLRWPNELPKDTVTTITIFSSDADLVKTTGMQLTDGRDIDIQKYPADSFSIMLNETAVKIMGLNNPVGQVIVNPFSKINWHIVGVVKDYVQGSPYSKIPPTVIYGPGAWFNMLYIKFNPANSTAAGLAKAERIFHKYNPAYPFDYKFADQEYSKKFNDEQKTKTMATLFAALAIFISCLGLFGLSAFMAESRIKEIGVRKVLGASIFNITRLLSLDFIKLVFVSFIIATPVAWFAMNTWLKDFSYRVTIGWTVFAVAGLSAIMIALLTVSFQSVRAALANPVQSLRTE